MTVSSTLASPRAPDAAVPRRARRHVGARSARANVHRGTQETQMSRTPRGWSILAVLALIAVIAIFLTRLLPTRPVGSRDDTAAAGPA